MNTRVLELLKDPKNIQSEDLHLLKEEINSFPYIQNIRALHLYGIHLYDKENYQKELSLTAAYTTDKKILYQLINGKIQQIQKPETKITEETKEEIAEPVQKTELISNEAEQETETDRETTSEKNQYEEAASLLQTPQPEIKHIYINGERNRILFEGEENFLNEENSETIDLESTLESGVIVTQKSEKSEEIIKQEEIEENIISDKAEETAVFTPETIIEEEKISSEQEKEEIEDHSELSFHETQSFLPEVDIRSNTDKEEAKNNESEETKETETIAEFTPEKIIEEEKISSETGKNSVQDDSELSFHGLESFLPEVKIQSNSSNETIQSEVPKSNVNKHEEEMRRLIEEVEKKMKAKKETSLENKEAEPEIISHDISFAETQAFHIEPSKENSEEKTEEKPQITESKTENVEVKSQESEKEITEDKKEPVAEVQPEIKSAWKPMTLESSLPDSLINKSVSETIQTKTEIYEPPKQELPVAEKIQEPVKNEEVEAVGKVLKEDAPKIEIQEEKENVPVMNVSFFGSDISSLSISDKIKEEETQETPKDNISSESLDSNVPGFINTWQNWLKIDRTEEAETSKAEIKNKVIESFIENNPKISQLKDEVNFVVKEKTDDISHLMTETLAKLYFEQKLYTKAMNAYQILANKHPEKKEYFEGKIQEIKDFRSKN